MKPIYLDITSSLGREALISVEVIQSLWGGYGELVRLHFPDRSRVIVKHVRLPEKSQHPKGWNTQLSHQRKVHSYQVETIWYRDYSQLLDERCPMPQGLLCKQSDEEWLIVMEDLVSQGFPDTRNEANSEHLDSCLCWLANFHAKHIGHQPTALWETGTYWHLDTRPDELKAMKDKDLQAQASKLDQLLTLAPYQTLVHGDAKLANFCFSHDGKQAAAVDFQYVGAGCAMKDVALFMSSAVKPDDCQQMEAQILDTYFKHLGTALHYYQPHLDREDVEKAWRPLFYVAWADFHRFVKGWSPDHWKINPYTEQLTRSVLANIGSEPL
ncbi:phosphotransferase [Vibrio makurazakiensis]